MPRLFLSRNIEGGNAWAGYFNDTLLGLEELHAHGILHHDIKPENLLLTADDRVKVSGMRPVAA
jgi:hypothetical protein